MINPPLLEIIKDYRKKAIEFNIIADRLERDYNVNVNVGSFDAYADSDKPTVGVIKAFIEEKSAARSATIAEGLKTTKEFVNEIVEANLDIFEKSTKGWIKLK